MSSLCKFHPDRPAIGPCDRCGTFGCADCLPLSGTQRLCPDCRARIGSDLPPLGGRASLAKMGLLGTGAAGLLLSGFEVAMGDNPPDDHPLMLLFGLAGLGYLAIFIGTIVVFLRWFHLATRYAHARGGAQDITPGWAVGWWFIPFANLVKPFNHTRSMLSATGGNAGMVGAWQATWILGNMVSNASSRINNSALSLASGVMLLAAAFFGMKVIEEVTRSSAGSQG